jgi:hypothetical protein
MTMPASSNKVLDAELDVRRADLRRRQPVDVALTLGAWRAAQPLCFDRPAQPSKARDSAFLLDQKGRVDPAVASSRVKIGANSGGRPARDGPMKALSRGSVAIRFYDIQNRRHSVDRALSAFD